MRFALTDDAVALAAGLRDTLARACPAAVVRAAWPGGDPATLQRLWRDLGGVGLFGLLVPTAAGGLGLDELHLVAAMEEVGFAGTPGPVVETVAFAAPLLAVTGPGLLVAEVLAGRSTVTARLGPGPVPYAQGCAAAVLGEPHALRLTTPGPGDVRALAAVDGSRGLGDIAGPGVPLDVDPALVTAAADRAALASAALLVGLSRRMIDMTVAYVRTRHQFGAPIGGFQAVQHALADALTGVEFARPAVLRAAGSLTLATRKQITPDEAAVHVSMAAALAADAAATVARTALQAHGAMGYTTEYDLHLFAKRVWAVTHDWGGPAHHRERVAAHLMLPAERSAP